VAALALALFACSSAPPDSAADLFKEYVSSTDVEGDVFRGDTSADRLAQFASEGTPDEVQASLLAAYPCGDDARGGCLPTERVRQAVRDFAGPDGTVYGRTILVKRHSGQLELMKLYVARRPDGSGELIDVKGERYSRGLDDFRSHNDLLEASDQILTLRDVLTVPGTGPVIVVSGHTGPNWRPWLIGGLVAVVIAIGVWVVLALARRGRLR
jgi:hypothetical protein